MKPSDKLNHLKGCMVDNDQIISGDEDGEFSRAVIKRTEKEAWRRAYSGPDDSKSPLIVTKFSGKASEYLKKLLMWTRKT